MASSEPFGHMTSLTGCTFCDIITGRATASRIYEDDRVLAFLDIEPVTPGHTLVVPKRHVAYFNELDAELNAAIFGFARLMAESLRRSGLRCDGVNLFLADGVAAFQEVFHTHIHVFPRFAGDGFRINADWQHRTPDELDSIASQIRKGLQAVS